MKCTELENRCFARTVGNRCSILDGESIRHPCPFCKPKREVTNGKHYPNTLFFLRAEKSRKRAAENYKKQKARG